MMPQRIKNLPFFMGLQNILYGALKCTFFYRFKCEFIMSSRVLHPPLSPLTFSIFEKVLIFTRFDASLDFLLGLFIKRVYTFFQPIKLIDQTDSLRKAKALVLQ